MQEIGSGAAVATKHGQYAYRDQQTANPPTSCVSNFFCFMGNLVAGAGFEPDQTKILTN